MNAVSGQEAVNFTVYAQVVGEPGHAPAAIPAHAAFLTIGIIIFHFKIESGLFIKQHQPVGADAEAAVAQLADPCRSKRVFTFTVIGDDKIVAGALVFDEL